MLCYQQLFAKDGLAACVPRTRRKESALLPCVPYAEADDGTKEYFNTSCECNNFSNITTLYFFVHKFAGCRLKTTLQNKNKKYLSKVFHNNSSSSIGPVLTHFYRDSRRRGYCG